MDWYYEQNGNQAGPVNEEQLKQLRAGGGLTDRSLVWRAGMADWVAYETQFAVAGLGPSAMSEPPALLDTGCCAECGKRVAVEDLVNLKGFNVCAACKPIALQKILEGNAPLGAGADAWRSGNKLIIKSNATLPDCCVKCGQPATTRLPRKLFWHHPALYILALSPIIYIIVALIVRKSGFVAVPLCEAHRARRKRGVLISWLIILLAFVSLGLGINSDEGGFFAGFAILFFTGLVVAIVMTRTVAPTKIDAQFIHLKGCCREFLDKLPPFFQ